MAKVIQVVSQENSSLLFLLGLMVEGKLYKWPHGGAISTVNTVHGMSCRAHVLTSTLYPSSRPRTFWASFQLTLTVVFITVVSTPVGASSGSERGRQRRKHKMEREKDKQLSIELAVRIKYNEVLKKNSVAQ